MPVRKRPRRVRSPPSASLIAALFLTPLLASLPIATLAATIIVAVLSLVDFKTPRDSLALFEARLRRDGGDHAGHPAGRASNPA